MPRSEAMSIQRPPMSVFIDAIESCVPPHARLGYAIDESDWDYPLYGRDLTRVPVRLPRADPLAAATASGIDWVVVRRGVVPLPPPSGWQYTELGITNFELLTPGPPCQLPPSASSLASRVGRTSVGGAKPIALGTFEGRRNG
jgi:hypothetical protein